MTAMDKIADSLENVIVGKRPPIVFSMLSTATSALYGAALAIRNMFYDRLPLLSHVASRPVISIGGIRAGGTGKTPVAAMIGEYLLSRGIGVAFLSRGYRRENSSRRIVVPDESVSWSAIGDEPALLHNRFPRSWLGIGANRCKTANLLSPLLPRRSAYVLDDGFQHRSLRRDLDIVCLHDSFLTDRLIPSGFLRERVSALARAQIALLIGRTENADALRRQRDFLAARFPHLHAAVVFQEMGCWVNAHNGRRRMAPPLPEPLLICGIARPGRFIDMVRRAGIVPCAELVFGDHHPYARSDFQDKGELLMKGVITTEKDAVRLASIAMVPIEKMWYLTIALRFSDPADETVLHSMIEKVIR